MTLISSLRMVGLGLGVVLSACSVPTSAQPSVSSRPPISSSPSPSASPSPSLFGLLSSSTSATQAHDTISILDTAGQRVASTTFFPRSVPNTGDLGALLLPEATAAGGRLFYWDGHGVVRTLSPSGAVEEVARYPLTDPQQELSVSVSPDGTRLMAALLTLPQPIRLPSGNRVFQNAPYQLDIYSGAVAGVQKVVKHQTGVITNFNPNPGLTAMVTWDTTGPLAISPQVLGSQGGARLQWYGDLVRLDKAGNVAGAAVADTDCRPLDFRRDGTAVCTVQSEQGRVLRVVDSNGSVAWQRQSTVNGFGYSVLSPDHSRVATIDLGPEVLQKNGPAIALPGTFYQDGWVTNQFLVGSMNVTPSVTHEAIINLDSPSAQTDLGYYGTFVGAI